jgi:putative ABC transport system ATP-binding protein
MARPARSAPRSALRRAQRVLRSGSRYAQEPQARSADRGDADVRDRASPMGSRRRDTPVIDMRDVRKTYRIGEIEVQALRGVSLVVQRGEYIAIMGASGSGKTTLMNLMGCLDEPTAGVYRLNGLDVRGIDEDTMADVRNRFIGFVFQSFNLIPRTPALANVELPLAYAGIPRVARRERALRAMQEVGLADRVHHQPSELSGGQQQRVAIARALVTNPAMILADEPTGNLDSASGAEVLELFARLNDEGRTIVLITHEDDVARHAQRVVRVKDGRVIADERREREEVS